ncbi:DMT family transporter [Paracoccus tegillarcae]|uniref:EamA family transporter n=1 Tax=Paracoccus tegillarcae TaxID=1529068 RepID=A0A2K9ECR9_9RHOB|nr:DMT family transporter [Paracoccus tegillarcae]AUH32723.1 EamA family transporter [Paracoccus tegillarcae]
MDIRAIFMGLSFGILWSSAFTSTRVIVLDAPPLTALVMRFLLSAVLGVLLARAMGQSWRLTRAEWRTVIIFGLCQNALYLGLNWVAMQRVEASAASIIASMLPLLVAAAGALFYGEKLRPMAVTGLLAGFAGVALIMGSRLTDGLDGPGVVMCLIAVVALTAATLVLRGTGGSKNVLMLVALQMAVGAIALLPFSLMFENAGDVVWSWTLVWAFLYTVLGPGLLATFIWFQLVSRIGATRAATFHFLTPFLGVSIAAAFLGERFGPTDLLGALIVAGGILMVQLSKVQTRGPAA